MFPLLQTCPWANASFMGSFARRKRPGRGIDNSPLSSPEVRTEQSYNSSPLRAWKAYYGETGRSQGLHAPTTNLDEHTR